MEFGRTTGFWPSCTESRRSRGPSFLQADPEGSWILQIRLCRIKVRKKELRQFGQEEEVDLLLG